jgi:hypothetical protein
MRLAYIISAYKHPEQLLRLVHRLNTDTTSFFVHVDKKIDPSIHRNMTDALREYYNVHFVKRYKCDWGGFGHVAASLEGIAEIWRTSTPFQYAILLTGQDYPIKPNWYIEKFFADRNGELFLDFFPLPDPRWCNRGVASGMERVEAWHWRVFNRHFCFPPSARVPFKRRFTEGFKPFGGSSYWCLSRECIEYIYHLTRTNPEFVNFFRRVDVPDELFFQTLILNSPFKNRVRNDNLRYIIWKDLKSGSPAILRVEDYPDLLGSSKLFARKFDITVDPIILDMIDRTLLDVPCCVH